MSGVAVEDVEKWFRAMGRGVTKTTAADYSDQDLRLAHLLSEYRGLGLDEDGLFALIRIIGRNIWAIADAAESLLRDRLVAISREHPEQAMRYAHELTRFAEFQDQVLAHVMSTHLRAQLKAEVADEQSPGAEDIAVCFADLVGFTALGEQVSPVELGRLAQRLDTLTTGVVEPPVRFVKMVGDAVMLISPDPTALCCAVLDIMRQHKWRVFRHCMRESHGALLFPVPGTGSDAR